jgi:large subunit ribosomal protein L28
MLCWVLSLGKSISLFEKGSFSSTLLRIPASPPSSPFGLCRTRRLSTSLKLRRTDRRAGVPRTARLVLKDFIYKDMTEMARICYVCSKGPMVANLVSHANNKVKRWVYPNVHKMHFVLAGAPTNKTKVIHDKVCTKCLKAKKVKKVL